METYLTEIMAIDPRSGILKRYSGPEILANSHSEAEKHCQENGLGYCKVIGFIYEEIPFEGDVENVTKQN